MDLCEKFFYKLVSEQIKNFLTTHKQFNFLMPKRRNKRMDEQSNSAASQSEDENYDDGHSKNHKKIEPAEVNMAKQVLMEKIATFKMIHENKCADGKSLSNESRKIQTLYII